MRVKERERNEERESEREREGRREGGREREVQSTQAREIVSKPHVISSKCRDMEGEQLERNDRQYPLETVYTRWNLQTTKRVTANVLVSLLPDNNGSPLYSES